MVVDAFSKSALVPVRLPIKALSSVAPVAESCVVEAKVAKSCVVVAFVANKFVVVAFIAKKSVVEE